MKLGDDSAQIVIDAVRELILVFERRLPELVEIELRRRERKRKQSAEAVTEEDDD